MKLSTIAQQIPASPIRKLVAYAEAAKKKGIKIYHLNIGDPDIETPIVMLNVLSRWTKNPISYSNSHGEASLLESLAWYYNNLGFTKVIQSNIQVTMGGSEGLLWTFLSICNPDEEIIVFEPMYANYISYATMTGVRLIPVLTKIDDGFHLPKKAEIESKITSQTKAILFCNPSNPTGTAYTEEELSMLVEIAKRNNLYIISDEVYREFIYNGDKTESLLKYMDSYPDGSIVVDSLSKRYSLCGIRVGVLVTKNDQLMESFLRYGQARLSAGLIDQLVAAELKHVDDDYFIETIARYKARRDTLVDGLSKIPGVICPNPEGAFYVIVKLPIASAEDFAKWLLTDFSDNDETVMVAPAAGFYHTQKLGKNEVRIAYVLNRKDLRRAIDIFAKGLNEYKQINKL